MLIFALILSIINLIGLVGVAIFFLRMWNKNIKEINDFSALTTDRVTMLEVKLKPYEDLSKI
jgi:hypothetical protein